MRLIYSILFVLLLPLIVLRMLWRSRRAPAYRRRLGERLGCFPAPPQDRPLIWVHAVSLGETLAARPLIERLLQELPDHRIAITTTTPTGSAQVQSLFVRRFGERIFHVYAPWDTPGAVRRCLDRLRPRLLLIMETELWPNLLHHCAAQGCPVMLANARLSARSATGYSRFPGVTRSMLGQLSLIAAQSDASAERFRELGAPADRVRVCGSVKFDLSIDPQLRETVATLRREWQLEQRQVLIAASTHEGEEALMLQAAAALREAHPSLLLILVPRHPERFDEIAALCERDGWPLVRRTSGEAVDGSTALLLVDTIGELLLFYGLADVAVVGGSFDAQGSRGGHNPLEPAAWGCAVVCGPSMFNFAEITEQLLAADALTQAESAAALEPKLQVLFTDADQRRRMGAAASRIVEENRGAVDRLAAGALELLSA